MEYNGRISEDVIRGPYERLKKKSPNHDLLKLVTVRSNGQGIRFSNDYYLKFSEVDDEWISDSYIRYVSALEQVTNKESPAIKNFLDKINPLKNLGEIFESYFN